MKTRSLISRADFDQVVELQRLTWGEGYTETVTASLLTVTPRIGGVVAGTFDEAGRMLGFVFGLSGVYAGGLAHWSHMLAVRKEMRDQGVGARLKAFQRDRMRELGIAHIYWTFDPLVARNAHFNLNRLGTALREYVPDMYGNTGSGLHAFGTDRFIVAWAVAEGAPNGAATAPAEVPDLSETDEDGIAAIASEHRQQLIVSIPEDISALTLEQARRWRARTRAAFVPALAAGYRVAGFDRARSAYVLTRE